MSRALTAFPQTYPSQVSTSRNLLGQLTSALSEEQEAKTARRPSYKVDTKRGIIYGVKLAQAESRNRGTDVTPVNLPRRYSESLMEKFVGTKSQPGLYHGIPVQEGHDRVLPKDRIGAVYNPRFEFWGGQRIIIGDWHLNTKHALYEQFMEDAEKFPDNMALSHEIFDWKQTLNEDHVLITDANKVEWFSLITDGGLNSSLVESNTTNSRKDNPVSQYADVIHAILGMKGKRMFRLNENTKPEELIAHYPQVVARLLEACACGGTACDTPAPPAQSPAPAPAATSANFDKALATKVEELKEENEKLQKQLNKFQLEKDLQEHFAELTKDMDETLVETCRPSTEQFANFANMEADSAKALLANHVSTIKSTVEKVQEQYGGPGSLPQKSLVEHIQYAPNSKPQGNPQGGRPNFAAYKGGFSVAESAGAGLTTSSTKLARHFR